jgi:hypothetical protein
MSPDWSAWLARRITRGPDGRLLALLPSRLSMSPEQAVEFAAFLRDLAQQPPPGRHAHYRIVGPEAPPLEASPYVERAVEQLVEPRGQKRGKRRKRR